MRVRQNGLSGCAHWCTKRSFRASVSEMALARTTKNQRLDLNFDFYYQILTTEDGPDCRLR